MAEEIKFEKAMEKLEKIVDSLESGDVALDDALKKYEEGIKLVRLCQERLSKAEKKVEVLTKTLSGKFKTEDFDSDDFEEDAPPKSKKKTKRKSEDDFFDLSESIVHGAESMVRTVRRSL